MTVVPPNWQLVIMVNNKYFNGVNTNLCDVPDYGLKTPIVECLKPITLYCMVISGSTGDIKPTRAIIESITARNPTAEIIIVTPQDWEINMPGTTQIKSSKQSLLLMDELVKICINPISNMLAVSDLQNTVNNQADEMLEIAERELIRYKENSAVYFNQFIIVPWLVKMHKAKTLADKFGFKFNVVSF